jgi:hypothetical protein
MSVFTVANEPMTDELGTGTGLASALTAYATLIDHELRAALIKLSPPNSEQRAWLLGTFRLDAPDVYAAINMTGRIFTEALFNERRRGYFFRELEPTPAKLAFVIDVLKGLDAFSGAVSGADRLVAALSDGSVRKVVDSLKSGEAERSEEGEADRREAERSDEGEAGEAAGGSEFAECVVDAIKTFVEDHEGFNNPKSYVHGLASTIAAVARAHIGTAETERSEAVEAVARKLAQNFHRACRYYGFLDASSAFARRGRSMAHTLRGLRLAFDGGSAQQAIVFMVEEQDSYLFGTTNLPRRLANLLLIATKQLTRSSARYTPHDITTDSYDSVGSAAPDAATNSLAAVPFEDLLRVARSSDSTYEAARKEILRREELCCAVRHILVGRREVPHKTCSYSGLVEFSSAAKEVRNKTPDEIARFGFSVEDAKTIAAALVKILRTCSSADATHKSLTEMCGLSLDHGPVFMGETEYRALILENEQNVNAIIGNALEAELRSIDPDHWNFDDYSTGTDETSAHHECRERREEPEAPETSVPASKRTRLA